MIVASAPDSRIRGTRVGGTQPESRRMLVHVINEAKYATAQHLITSGAWTVNADAGQVISARHGRPIGFVGGGGRWRLQVPNGPGRQLQVLRARVIWEAVNGRAVPDGFEVDHRDGDRTNDRAVNLRVVPAAQNAALGGASARRRPRATPALLAAALLTIGA